MSKRDTFRDIWRNISKHFQWILACNLDFSHSVGCACLELFVEYTTFKIKHIYERNAFSERLEYLWNLRKCSAKVVTNKGVERFGIEKIGIVEKGCLDSFYTLVAGKCVIIFFLSLRRLRTTCSTNVFYAFIAFCRAPFIAKKFFSGFRFIRHFYYKNIHGIGVSEKEIVEPFLFLRADVFCFETSDIIWRGLLRLLGLSECSAVSAESIGVPDSWILVGCRRRCSIQEECLVFGKVELAVFTVPFKGGGIAENLITVVFGIEPGIGAVAPVVGEVRRSVLLAEKCSDGAGACLTECSRAELGNGDYIKVLKNDLTAFHIHAPAIGKYARRKDDCRNACRL